MSATLFKKFLACEADAMDSLINPREEETQALLIGNYIHSKMESNESHEEFIKEYNDAFFTKSGRKRADTELADKMICKLQKDDFFNFFYNSPDCEKEVIITGKLFDYPWKARIDSLNVEKGYFCDLKTTRELHKHYWSVEKHKWVSFIEAYNYALQMGVYKRLLQHKYKKPFNCYIFAIDKTAEPEMAAVEIPTSDMDKQLEIVKNNMQHVINLVYGLEHTKRCGRCEFCKRTQKLTGFIKPDDLIVE